MHLRPIRLVVYEEPPPFLPDLDTAIHVAMDRSLNQTEVSVIKETKSY